MNAVTVFGVCALGFMMVMYALERRHSGFEAGFAVGCLVSSVYGFLSGAWPFGVVEAIWAVVAGRRYLLSRRLQLRLAIEGTVDAAILAGDDTDRGRLFAAIQDLVRKALRP